MDARAGLLCIFALHLFLAYRLWQMNRAARPVPYVMEDTVEASWASRNMMYTGLVLLVFIIYHLAHFTFGVTTHAKLHGEVFNYLDLRDPAGRPDVYSMVVSGFSNPWIALFYVISQVFLCLHLWHGGSSWFQSLGLNHPQYNPVIRKVGPVLAILVFVGNCSMPLAVLFGLIKPV